MNDARIILIVQLHELISQIENTLYLFGGDDEGRKRAEGCIAYARKVSDPFNYNGPTRELADAQAEIARLRGALEPDRIGGDFLDWVADRLVKTHGDSENADFVIALRRIAQNVQNALEQAK